MMAAMKARDKERKDAISSLVSAVKKNAIDAGCRDDIPATTGDAQNHEPTKNADKHPFANY